MLPVGEGLRTLDAAEITKELSDAAETPKELPNEHPSLLALPETILKKISELLDYTSISRCGMVNNRCQKLIFAHLLERGIHFIGPELNFDIIFFNPAFQVVNRQIYKIINYVNEARKEINLNQFKKADEFYSQAMWICGENIPIWLLEDAAFAKKDLSLIDERMWQSTDDLFTRVLEEYGKATGKQIKKESAKVRTYQYYKNVPAIVYETSAFVKMKLGSWWDAHLLCHFAKRAYGPNLPRTLIKNWAITKQVIDSINEQIMNEQILNDSPSETT